MVSLITARGWWSSSTCSREDTHTYKKYCILVTETKVGVQRFCWWPLVLAFPRDSGSRAGLKSPFPFEPCRRFSSWKVLRGAGFSCQLAESDQRRLQECCRTCFPHRRRFTLAGLLLYYDGPLRRICSCLTPYRPMKGLAQNQCLKSCSIRLFCSAFWKRCFVGVLDGSHPVRRRDGSGLLFHGSLAYFGTFAFFFCPKEPDSWSSLFKLRISRIVSRSALRDDVDSGRFPGCWLTR